MVISVVSIQGVGKQQDQRYRAKMEVGGDTVMELGKLTTYSGVGRQ